MPEYPSVGNPSSDIGKITDILNRWLSKPEILQQVEGELIELRDELVRAGATALAASTILQRLDAEQITSHLEAA